MFFHLLIHNVLMTYAAFDRARQLRLLADGVVALCDLLELFEMKPRKRQSDWALIMNVLRCIRALMNVELGMDAIGPRPAVSRARACAVAHVGP